ncbi:MAG: hypothetical protein ACLUIS_01635 [Longibaculum sp.]
MTLSVLMTPVIDESLHIEEKQRICKKAAQRIKGGDCIILILELRQFFVASYY